MKTIHDTAVPSRGRTESNREIISKNGKDASSVNETSGEAKIWEDGKVGIKPRYLISSKSVINLKSDFQHKLLCDGPTFTAGHACTFSCAFCYVEAMMRKNANLNALLEFKGLKHEQVVVEIDDPITAVREKLLRSGKPLFGDKSDRRVIYGSPLVDVAGTPAQAKVTIAICREILAHTHWQIRLLSKSKLLADVAKELSDYKERMIYGFSTGTLDNDITRSFEIGTTSVSERLKALRQLQNDGYRTFGMLCPILPQADYAAFAADVADKIDLGKVEDVWAEVLNSRGDAMQGTSAALRAKNFNAEADLLDKVGGDTTEWNKYAEQTFLALASVIPAKKLHFLQYVEKDEYGNWEKHTSAGAVLLGGYPKLMNAVSGNDFDVEAVEPLDDKERKLLVKNEGIVRRNIGEFVAVGLALKEIRDNELYRETHSTFEGYCLAKFDFGKAYGYRMIGAAEVVEKLKNSKSPIGDNLMPKTESQVRELIKLPDDKRIMALKLAAKNAGKRPLNALFIQRAAIELTPAPAVKRTTHYTPARYTTDLKTFLSWLQTLKALAVRGDKDELLRLLNKAEKERQILPDMPEMILIREVKEKYGWLGNMSPHPVEYKRQTFLTTEALFQWLRFEGHIKIQNQIAACKSPMGVKMLAKKYRHLLADPDGETDLEMMRLCLRLKIEQHEDLKKLLLATGDKVIVEDCSARPRGDAFYWGWANINGQWVGENWLGRLWMDLRDNLRGLDAEKK